MKLGLSGNGACPGSVRVMKRSEERLYTNSVKQLRQILEAEINFDAVPPAKFIFENILKTENGDSVNINSESERTGESEGSEEIEDGDLISESQTPPGQILRVYNKKLLQDESKKRALLACAQCPPVSIIQGPPGTGQCHHDQHNDHHNLNIDREDHVSGGGGAESRVCWSPGAGGDPEPRRL